MCYLSHEPPAILNWRVQIKFHSLFFSWWAICLKNQRKQNRIIVLILNINGMGHWGKIMESNQQSGFAVTLQRQVVVYANIIKQIVVNKNECNYTRNSNKIHLQITRQDNFIFGNHAHVLSINSSYLWVRPRCSVEASHFFSFRFSHSHKACLYGCQTKHKHAHSSKSYP